MFKTFLTVSALFLGMQAFAQYDDSFMFDDAIDIDGVYTESDSKVSPSDRMKAMRAQLEKRNEMLVRRKIENVRLQQEMEMMKKLNQTMNQTFKQMDNALNNM